MRKLLYSLTFAFVLLLAGYAGVKGAEIPSDGGTVPANTLWLPIVELAYRYTGDLSNLPEGCPYRAVALTPEDGVVIQYGDMITFTWTVVDRHGYVVPLDRDGWLNRRGFELLNMDGYRGGPFYGRRILLDSASFGIGHWTWRISVHCVPENEGELLKNGVSDVRDFIIVNGSFGE